MADRLYLNWSCEEWLSPELFKRNSPRSSKYYFIFSTEKEDRPLKFIWKEDHVYELY